MHILTSYALALTVLCAGCERKAAEEQSKTAAAPLSVSAGESIGIGHTLTATVLFADDAPGGSQVFVAIDNSGPETLLEFPRSAAARFSDGRTSLANDNPAKVSQPLRSGRNIVSIHVPHKTDSTATQLVTITAWGASFEVPKRREKKPVDTTSVSGELPTKASSGKGGK